MFDTFAKMDGIPGECTDDKHKDWIEILSFNHGIRQPASATAASAGGGTAERCDHEDFTIVKYVDSASPKIYEACCTGKHLKEVTIDMCRAGGEKLKYMEVKLENVIVSHVAPGGNSKGGDGFPTESVSFNYATIAWTYTKQKREGGGAGGNVTAGWDLTANKTK